MENKYNTIMQLCQIQFFILFILDKTILDQLKPLDVLNLKCNTLQLVKTRFRESIRAKESQAELNLK